MLELQGSRGGPVMVGAGRVSKEENDLTFTCGLSEYIARKTKNTRSDVVEKLGKDRSRKNSEGKTGNRRQDPCGDWL